MEKIIKKIKKAAKNDNEESIELLNAIEEAQNEMIKKIKERLKNAEIIQTNYNISEKYIDIDIDVKTDIDKIIEIKNLYINNIYEDDRIIEYSLTIHLE